MKEEGWAYTNTYGWIKSLPVSLVINSSLDAAAVPFSPPHSVLIQMP